MARKVANMLSGSEVHKEAATEPCWACEELAADAFRRPSGFRAAVPDVENVAGPRGFDQAACRLEAIAEVVETTGRGLLPRDVCRSLLR